MPIKNQLIRKLDKLKEKFSNLDNSLPNYKWPIKTKNLKLKNTNSLFRL